MSKQDIQTIPKNLKQLRACISCGLIKTYDAFQGSGCENCPQIRHNVDDYTSTTFEGYFIDLT